MTLLKSIDGALGKVMRWFCITNLLILMVMLALLVFVRFVRIDWFTSSTAVIDWFKLSWSDEIIEWLMSSLIFIAAADLWRQRDHFRIEVGFWTCELFCCNFLHVVLLVPSLGR